MTKQRIRHGLLAIAVSGVAVWAGYSAMHPAEAQNLVTVSTGQKYSIEDQYPDLPPAVARAVQGVVAVQRVTGANDTGVIASGVIFNDSQILTAGHITGIEDNPIACSSTYVNVQDYFTPAAGSRLSAVTGASLYNKTSTYSTDVALLTVKADANFRQLPNALLARSKPKAGDSVFLMNYQPKADGSSRSPDKTESSDPAVMSAIVLGSGKYGLVVATGGGPSYSRGDSEITLRKGSSGGAVLDAQGGLVGLSVSTESLQANRSAEYIAANYGVRLAEQQYQVTHVQSLDSQLISELQASQASCS